MFFNGAFHCSFTNKFTFMIYSSVRERSKIASVRNQSFTITMFTRVSFSEIKN